VEKKCKDKPQLPYGFLNAYGTDRVKRFDKAWKNACKQAKIGLRRFHGLRQTAVRNMVTVSGTVDQNQEIADKVSNRNY
jgi:integrase